MLPLVFTNARVAPERQFEAVRAAYDGVVEFLPTPESAAGFSFSQRVWPMGRCLLVTMSLPVSSAPLRWCHAERSVFDHWYAVLPCRFVNGQAMPALSGRAAGLHSLAHPHDVTLTGEGALLLFVPRGAVRTVEAPQMVTPGHGLPTLLGDMMLALANRLPGLDAVAIAHAAEAMCVLLGGVVASAPARAEPATATGNDPSVLERARQMIRARLKDERLEPEAICRELAVSRSRLYRVFTPLGGIAAYIRRQRLMQARHALVDPSEARPIMTIAEEWGFRDPSVFSRAFRQEFGLSPREVRGIGPSAAARTNASAGAREHSCTPPSLASLLHGLVG